MKKASLLVQSDPTRGRTYPLATSPVVLGRSDECDLKVGEYHRVSRRHAQLEWNGTSLTIRDLNSTNGVVVNGQRVAQTTLKNGDRLNLGDFAATVVIEGGHPQKSGIWGQMVARWNAWPATPSQKTGVALGAAIVLLLGGIGMSTGRAPARSSSGPTATIPADDVATSKIPDASGATATQTVTAIEPVDGRISPAAIQNAKAATVLIAHRGRDGHSMGSGFALGDSKRIITNRHVVVDERGQPQDLLLIFEAGTPRERKLSVPAQNITLAPQAASKDGFQDDLASISLPEGQTPALPAGKSEELVETDEVYAIGFPLGIQTLTLNGDLPSVSVKPARIERLQSDKNGAVTVIQLGSSVTHGNSGGPVVNKRGEVVGVISSGVEGTSMSYAIPMVFVNALP